jgi:hypothetical protein
VYVSEATGHNVGAAIVEALLYACDGNADLAWELIPEDDYLTGRVENYDEVSHQVIAKKNLDGRGVRGILYFVRLHTDISEIAKKAQRKEEEVSSGSVSNAGEQGLSIDLTPDKERQKKKANKKSVKDLVARGDADNLVRLCFDDKKTFRLMQRLLYDPQEENRWHTAWIIGRVSAGVSTRRPGQVSELLHRLFEACSDSAATPWGMIETLGYIISMRPDIFGAFTKHLLNYLGDPSTRPQVLWALAEVAGNRPDLIRDTPFYSLFDFLQDPDPRVRGNTARLLGRIQASETAIQLMGLTGDGEGFSICLDGKLITSTVAAEAATAIEAIRRGREQ